MNSRLLNLVLKSATMYQRKVGGSGNKLWATIVKMLSNLCTLQGESSFSATGLITTIGRMEPGGI